MDPEHTGRLADWDLPALLTGWFFLLHNLELVTPPHQPAATLPPTYLANSVPVLLFCLSSELVDVPNIDFVTGI